MASGVHERKGDSGLILILSRGQKRENYPVINKGKGRINSENELT